MKLVVVGGYRFFPVIFLIFFQSQSSPALLHTIKEDLNYAKPIIGGWVVWSSDQADRHRASSFYLLHLSICSRCFYLRFPANIFRC